MAAAAGNFPNDDPITKKLFNSLAREKGKIMANPEHVHLVMAGGDALDEFRKKNPEVKLDLRGADFHGRNLSCADLGRADLREANLSETILIATDLYQTDLSGANLGHADLSEANLFETRLVGADLAEAVLEQTCCFGADFTSARGLEAEQLAIAILWSMKGLTPQMQEDIIACLKESWRS